MTCRNWQAILCCATVTATVTSLVSRGHRSCGIEITNSRKLALDNLLQVVEIPRVARGSIVKILETPNRGGWAFWVECPSRRDR